MNESVNRAFLYGESVFTTMRMIDGHACDWEMHFDRMKRGIDFLYGPFIESESDNWVQMLKEKLENHWKRESANKVIRLTVYLEQARGLKQSSHLSVNDLRIFMDASPLNPTQLETKTISLRTCPALLRPSWWPAYLKAGNYLDTILAQKLYLQEGDDDLLFLSQRDTVLESSVANIFIVRHDKIYTAPLGPNVLDGVMRKKVLGHARDFFADCLEHETNVEQLSKADGIFGSNSIRGIFLVDRLDGSEIKYTQSFLDNFEEFRKRVLV